jgi:nucleotide-binding universal stress UspA family protein
VNPCPRRRDEKAASEAEVRIAGTSAAPIVAAVEGSTASRAAVDAAVRLACDFEAPVVFVYVRRGPAGFLGAPLYQRRLTAEMKRARAVLEDALNVAGRAGVAAEGEVLEGSPERRISEFARDRAAQLLIVGSRRRRLTPSVSAGVIRTAGRPVIVAASVAG